MQCWITLSYRRSSCALESDPSYLERPTCLSKPRVARKSSACWHRRRILRKPPAHYHIIQTPINTASIRCAHLGINSIAFENRASSVMIASAMASDKYPLSLPALKSSNGRTAIRYLSAMKLVPLLSCPPKCHPKTTAAKTAATAPNRSIDPGVFAGRSTGD